LALPVRAPAQAGYFREVVPTTFLKEIKHEQVCTSIACDLALSIPRGLGAEVPISDAAGAGRAGGLQVCDDVLSAVGL